MDYIFYPFADFCQWLFENLIEPSENLPNKLFIAGGFLGLFYWIRLQGKFNKEAEKNGTLK